MVDSPVAMRGGAEGFLLISESGQSFSLGEMLKWRCAFQNSEWDLFRYKMSQDLFEISPSLCDGVSLLDQLGVEKCRKGKHLWEVWALRPDIFTLLKIIDTKSQNAANLTS